MRSSVGWLGFLLQGCGGEARETSPCDAPALATKATAWVLPALDPACDGNWLVFDVDGDGAEDLV